ncbi:HVO_A0114 family putative DNA-binding protein [Caenispirillum salinarum]|uniref:HVO_A0114 family putative DNA-binding protein n=1 Tax=Caenispirillum salinarum TaxID=859058 RepID=UPI0005BA989C|nr:helix-turn-helix domain-containing protein [Caenispirillum salinarum]
MMNQDNGENGAHRPLLDLQKLRAAAKPRKQLSSKLTVGDALANGGWPLLRAIYRDRPHSVSELADTWGEDRSKVSRMVSRLIEFDLVRSDASGNRNRLQVTGRYLVLDLKTGRYKLTDKVK